MPLCQRKIECCLVKYTRRALEKQGEFLFFEKNIRQIMAFDTFFSYLQCKTWEPSLHSFVFLYGNRDTMTDDLQLIEDFQRGNAKAFEELVKKYQRQVANTIYATLGKRNDVEDLTQEVFIKAYFALKTLKLTTSFSAWIYRVTVNLCIDEIRKKKVRQFLSFENVPDTTDAHSYIGHTVVELERTELRELIDQAIQQLPTDYRIAVVLRDVEGRSHEEMCDILQVPLGTVKSRIARGREALRKKLQSYLKE
jgi:RNA polymerase sigma-70 factor (ECF subfamily)